MRFLVNFTAFLVAVLFVFGMTGCPSPSDPGPDTTEGEVGAFDLLLPTNNATNVATNATFSWASAANAAKYKLTVATNSGFTENVKTKADITGTSAALDTSLDNDTKYYWKVEVTDPENKACNAVFSFTTKSLGQDEVGSFALLTPANDASAVAISPTFTWGTAANATAYKLTVATNAGFTTGVITKTGLTGTSATLDAPLSYATTYYWKVEATAPDDKACNAAFSFKTESAPPVSREMTKIDDIDIDSEGEGGDPLTGQGSIYGDSLDAILAAPAGSVLRFYITCDVANSGNNQPGYDLGAVGNKEGGGYGHGNVPLKIPGSATAQNDYSFTTDLSVSEILDCIGEDTWIFVGAWIGEITACELLGAPLLTQRETIVITGSSPADSLIGKGNIQGNDFTAVNSAALGSVLRFYITCTLGGQDDPESGWTIAAIGNINGGGYSGNLGIVVPSSAEVKADSQFIVDLSVSEVLTYLDGKTYLYVDVWPNDSGSTRKITKCELWQ